MGREGVRRRRRPSTWWVGSPWRNRVPRPSRAGSHLGRLLLLPILLLLLLAQPKPRRPLRSGLYPYLFFLPFPFKTEAELPPSRPDTVASTRKEGRKELERGGRRIRAAPPPRRACHENQSRKQAIKQAGEDCYPPPWARPPPPPPGGRNTPPPPNAERRPTAQAVFSVNLTC